jgi:enoyl-CoA hydratase/carnithine racemase
MQLLFNKIENLEKPVIAAVNGYALGLQFRKRGEKWLYR